MLSAVGYHLAGQFVIFLIPFLGEPAGSCVTNPKFCPMANMPKRTFNQFLPDRDIILPATITSER